MSKVKIIYEMKNFISHTATSYIGKLQTYCIYCNSYRNEWFGVKGFIHRRGRCFYCRIDRLDRRYGPSMTVKMVKQLRKHLYHRYQIIERLKGCIGISIDVQGKASIVGGYRVDSVVFSVFHGIRCRTGSVL